ncbi:type VI secretion system protein ImpG [Cricetibacter osteomyelitidis]|uniref:Type VI secretion system protein ImpG n=1 Tax=Cricetibacter osteomyelitidis TaxID=1521931 RepID=A0A4R2SRE7_9PAST|nr:type VI secretion system baseplate subunit TssF [Cricetibacter osteomyelitidis]TCP91171.1 type VI secretion system protein ImpG [Cricetibacter osteomyelitidis]
MSLKEIFRAELDFLKKDGKYFSQIHPHLSRFLSDEIIDPEAERIIESFAFLTARLREKIQDSFPELTQSMLQLLWPNYLRPLPSCSMIRFSPKERAITTKHIIPKGTFVLSKPVDGTPCRFQTTMDVAVYPLVLHSVESNITSKATILELQLNNISENNFVSLECDDLTIHLSGSDYSALTCYQWLFNYLDKISVRVGDREIVLPLDCVEQQGISNHDALIPYPENAFEGHRLIQEFFFFPKKFYFFKLKNLNYYLKSIGTENFKLLFKFNRPIPRDLTLTLNDFSLYCSPIINLFDNDAIPINLNGKKTTYPIIPAGTTRAHFDVFDIKKVSGVKLNEYAGKTEQLSLYERFETFAHSIDDKQALPFYKILLKENMKGGYDHYIAFVSKGNEFDLQHNETISVELQCTNGHLPENLGIGDICIPSQDTPSYINFENITRPRTTVRPSLDGSLQWQLIANLSLNYVSLNNLDVLKEALMAYDFSGVFDLQSKRRTEQRLEAIREIDTFSADRIIKGVVYRGLKSVIKIEGDKFLCEGEVFLFGTILSEFFRLFGTINSFHELEIVNINNNEIFKWDWKTTLQQII